MSDPGIAAVLAGEDVSRTVARLVREGRADELVEALLREAADEHEWRRQRVLARVAGLEQVGPLLEPLTAALRDEARPERRNAARCLFAALGSPGAGSPLPVIDWLGGVLASEPSPDVRLLTASSLGESSHPAALVPLTRALTDPDPNVVAAAVEALGALGDPRAVDALLPIAEGEVFWTRIAAIIALGQLCEPRALPVLTRAVADPALSSAAVGALREIGDPTGLPALRAAVELGGGARAEAIEAAVSLLGRHPELEAPGWLRAAVQGSEAELARRLSESPDADTARLLGLVGTHEAARRLLDQLPLPGHGTVAAVGISMLPPDVAEEAILARLPEAEAPERTLLLGALPPLTDPAAVDRVADLLAEPHEETRAAAVEALCRSSEPVVLRALAQAVRDPRARLGAAQTYARLSGVRCDPLDGLLDDADPAVRAAAAEGLARCGPEYAEPLRRALRRETHAATRRALVRALGALGGEDAVAELEPLLDSEDAALRFEAVRALGRTRSPEAFDPLLRALGDARAEVQAAALHALGELEDARAAAPLTAHLGAPDRDLRRTAAFALDRLAPPGAVDRLADALRDEDREVRLTAVRILARLGDAWVAPALERTSTSDPDALVRREAYHALEALRAGGGDG